MDFVLFCLCGIILYLLLVVIKYFKEIRNQQVKIDEKHIIPNYYINTPKRKLHEENMKTNRYNRSRYHYEDDISASSACQSPDLRSSWVDRNNSSSLNQKTSTSANSTPRRSNSHIRSTYLDKYSKCQSYYHNNENNNGNQRYSSFTSNQGVNTFNGFHYKVVS